MLGVQFSRGFLTILLDLDSSSLSSKEVKKKKEKEIKKKMKTKSPLSSLFRPKIHPFLLLSIFCRTTWWDSG